MESQAAPLELAQVERVSVLVRELAACDVSGHSNEELLELNDAVARLGRLAGALQARLAGQIAGRSAPQLPGGGLARQHGYGSAQTLLARASGGSASQATRTIDAGLAFASPGMPGADAGATRVSPAQPRYPAVAAASLNGDLSTDAAGIIVAALESIIDRVPGEVMHRLEASLVDKAQRLTAHEIRKLVANAIARADYQGHRERERRNYQNRYLSWTEDSTGMVTFTGQLDAVTAAPIRTAIEQAVTHAFRSRRDQDPLSPDTRTVGQMRADALFDLCRHALGCEQTASSGIRTTIVVRVNKAEFESGHGLGSVDGVNQAISVPELRRLAGDAGILPAVLGHESEVLDLGRTKRMFSKAQRLALLERDGGCAKCHAPPEHCEAHHIRWWEHGGATDLLNGVMLCTRCHHDVHRQGWEILATPSTVTFIPPPDLVGQSPLTGGAARLRLDGSRADHDLDTLVEAGARASGPDRAAAKVGEREGERHRFWSDFDDPTGPLAVLDAESLAGVPLP